MTSLTYTAEELQAFANTMPGKKVLILGDIMLDRYLHGDSFRISPEAPVPVVQVERQQLLLGGAGNVARNIKRLGGEPILFSVCGEDRAAEEFKNICQKEGITARLLAEKNRKTTSKNRLIARHQQVMRFDEEVISDLTAAEEAGLLADIAPLLAEHDVLILSDYGKGVINKSLLAGLNNLIAQKNQNLKVLVDPKTPNYPLYKGVWLLTPNAKETSEATGLATRTHQEIKAAGQALLKQTNAKHLLTTLGPDGMALFNSPDNIWHIPTTARNVFDVTGAGDTVIALTGLALAAGIPLLAACLIANYAAGIVVGEIGTATVNMQQLQDAIKSHQSNLLSTW